MIWAVLLSLAALSAFWLVWPYLRGTVLEGGDDAAVSIYSDQMDEVARDRDRGLIGTAEADAALSEIAQRRSRAARGFAQEVSVARRNPVAAVFASAVLIAIAIGGYLWTGAHGVPDQPLHARAQEQLEQRAAAGDLTARIQLLIDRVEAEPESFEAWWVLARSHAAVGDHAASAEAYCRAVLLRGDDPGVLSAYAEAMTLANGNKVPEGAEIIFSQVARETSDPRAFYYLALARAQRQDFRGALEDWAALAQASDSTAPWMPLVRRDMVNMARMLGEDIASYLPDATPAELAAARPGGTSGGDLSALHAAVASDPMDFEARMALVRAEAAAGDSEAAAEALAEARAAFRGAPYLMEKIGETERALGLDLVAVPKGPDAEDVAAAAQMTEADRDAMVRGMVAGLAARLEDAPDDPEGWAMLIRSYRVLGDAAAADAALARAEDLFDGAEAIKALLRGG